MEASKMSESDNSKDLIRVSWSGADILRSKMDANEYKKALVDESAEELKEQIKAESI